MATTTTKTIKASGFDYMTDAAIEAWEAVQGSGGPAPLMAVGVI